MDSTIQTARSDRYVALDGLRGVAALFVALYHLQVSNHVTHFQLVRNGYLAVDLFFILSGFVICSRYSSRIASPTDVLRFIGFRFFRVYPMHLVTLLVLLGLEVLKLYSQRSGLISGGDRVAFTGSTSWEALLANLALIQGLGIFDSQLGTLRAGASAANLRPIWSLQSPPLQEFAEAKELYCCSQLPVSWDIALWRSSKAISIQPTISASSDVSQASL